MYSTANMMVSRILILIYRTQHIQLPKYALKDTWSGSCISGGTGILVSVHNVHKYCFRKQLKLETSHILLSISSLLKQFASVM